MDLLNIISRQRHSTSSYIKEISLGAKSMVSLLNLIGLVSVIFGSISSIIFANAGTRTFTGSRIPAIMSAMGVTNWYITQHQDSQYQEAALVMDLYPLAFIRQVFAKYGAQFLDSNWTDSRRLRTSDDVSDLLEKPCGGLLPFASITHTSEYYPTQDRFPYFPEVRFDILNHPAVQSSWRIDANGTVRITSAGICASTDIHLSHSSRPETSIRSWVTWSREGGALKFQTTDNLGSFLRKTMDNDGVVYAVTLYQDRGRRGYQRGVLLQGPRSMIRGQMHLVKIGFFTVIDHLEMPLSQDVDWVVL